MAEYIEKLRVLVRVCQSGREPMTGTLSLSPHAEHHHGPETILERLNAKNRVIPFRRLDDGATLMLSRLELEWVEAGPAVDAEWICPRSFRITREERVLVRFTSGTEMEGLLQMELPEMINRASDFLNSVEDFFPLVTLQGTLLVNKQLVLDVRVFESSPLPLMAESD